MKRPCGFCGQETKGCGSRVWFNGVCFCSRGCVENYKKRIAELDEKRRKQTIAEREQMRLLEWFN